jgi:hypothetical protein
MAGPPAENTPQHGHYGLEITVKGTRIEAIVRRTNLAAELDYELSH